MKALRKRRDKESKKATFYLCRNLDNRELRYYLHKLEFVQQIDAEKLKEVIETRKTFKRTITLSKKEEEIIKRFGKAANIVLNYVILVEGHGA
jgi:hypothetical protein